MKQAYLGTLVTVGSDGVIPIPMDKLATAGITSDSQVEVFATHNEVTIRLADGFCAFCNKNGNLREISENKICNDCVKVIAAEVQEMNLDE